MQYFAGGGLPGPRALAALIGSLALAVLPAPAVRAETGEGDGPAKGSAASRFADIRAKVEKEDAEASDAALREKLKAGTLKRLDFGDGVHLDLIKVGEGADAYYLGRYEVTQEQYRLVTGENPSGYDGSDRAGHPVENVSWDDAMAFCKLLNAAFGKEMGGHVFSLPTEAQWENAARAGEKTKYSGSDDLDEVAWYTKGLWGGNSGGHTHEVGGKKANAWGFHDMTGNVDEWCLDADGSDRALRGGCYYVGGFLCRVGCGLADNHGHRNHGLGFRVAASLSEEKKAQAEAERLAALKAAAEAYDAPFLGKVKAGTAKRLDLGDGVHLDLIKVGEGDDAYYLGRYEVTQEQYQLVTDKNPSNYDGPDRARHPVENVSWNDARAFYRLLDARFGKELPAGYYFSLPTEAQWEKAAYAGEETEYAGGDDLGEVGWYDGNSDGQTHAVGGKKANAWGFHDMSGNVREWCLDGGDSGRAYRGGGAADGNGKCRVGNRDRDSPGSRFNDLGFRIAAPAR